MTYRKPKAGCEVGSVCATKPVAKWNKVVLWLATGVVLVAAAFPSLSLVILHETQPDLPVAVKRREQRRLEGDDSEHGLRGLRPVYPN